jgi:Flp pilus assembly pilin Flp
MVMPRFLKDRRGVSAIEYALLAAVLCLALHAVLQAPAHALVDAFNSLLSGNSGAGQQ